MRPQAVVLWTMLAFALTGCQGRSTRLCEADRFFCQKEKDWSSTAARLTELRLYEIDIAHYNAVGGGNSIIEKELGKRGWKAFRPLLDQEIKIAKIAPILPSLAYYVREESGYDICETKKSADIRNRELLHEIGVALAHYCKRSPEYQK